MSLGWYVQVNEKALNKIFYELKTIGNNLNQIAKVANTNGQIYSNEIEEMQNSIQQILVFVIFYRRFMDKLQNGLLGKKSSRVKDNSYIGKSVYSHIYNDELLKAINQI